MRLVITKSDWGMEYLGDLPARQRAFSGAGFDGVESFFVDISPSRFLELCDETGLEFNGGMVAPTVEAFRSELARVLPYRPSLINCHAGRDYYDFDQGLEFFRQCMDIARNETDIQVVYETHRRCTLYSPWGTRRYLEAIPELRITADFSHFTVVSEGNMQTSASAVPDARIGEDYKWTEIYELWWDRIIQKRLQEGREFITVCPEWGPPPYAPVNPQTGEPHAHPWDLSIWSMQRFRERWQDILES